MDQEHWVKTLAFQGTSEDLEFEKASYIGNKGRLAGYISAKFPEGAKTIFDPMCGCSAVLIEAARKGYQVIGNDLSILPYWYSKGVFEGAALTEDDVKKLTQAKPQSGWLTTEWKGMYPRKPEIRKFIDGLVLATRDFTGKKQLAARAVASRLLQTMYSETGSGYSTRNWETMEDVQRILGKAIKEVTGLIAEVSGKGTITCQDSRTMSFPSADVIYFDPPFFIRDKGAIKYFEVYKVVNSILLQEKWKEKNLEPEELPEILSRLCKAGKHVFVSTARNSQTQWAAELSRHKRTIKKFKVTYHQTSGFGSRDEKQKQNLLIGKAHFVGTEAGHAAS